MSAFLSASRWRGGPSLSGSSFPIFQIIRPVPPLAWIPLTILWLGIGDVARMSVVFIAALVPWLMNSMLAVYSVDKLLIDAGKTLGASDTADPDAHRLSHRLADPCGRSAHGAWGAPGRRWWRPRSWRRRQGLVTSRSTRRSLLDTDVLIVAMIMIGILGIALTALIELSSAPSRPLVRSKRARGVISA